MAKMAKNRKETGPLQWVLYRNSIKGGALEINWYTDSRPNDITVNDINPKDIIPKDTILKDTIPKDTIPNDIMPEQHNPECDIMPNNIIPSVITLNASQYRMRQNSKCHIPYNGVIPALWGNTGRKSYFLP